MEGKFEGKNFLFSGHDPELKDMRLDWLGVYKIISLIKIQHYDYEFR